MEHQLAPHDICPDTGYDSGWRWSPGRGATVDLWDGSILQLAMRICIKGACLISQGFDNRDVDL